MVLVFEAEGHAHDNLQVRVIFGIFMFAAFMTLYFELLAPLTRERCELWAVLFIKKGVIMKGNICGIRTSGELVGYILLCMRVTSLCMRRKPKMIMAMAHQYIIARR